VNAALEIILAKGIDALRLEDVLEIAGTSKGSLYWHFEDRTDLIREAIAEHLRRMNEETIILLDALLSTEPSRDEYVLQLQPVLADPWDGAEVDKRWQKMELLVAARRDPMLWDLMQDLQRRSLRIYTELVSRARDLDILRRDVDVAAVAISLQAITMGSVLIEVVGDDAPSPEAWFGLMLVLVQSLFPDQIAN